jgi:hypothetical protein
VSSEQILSLQRTVVPLRVRNQRHIKEDLNPQKQFCETLKLKKHYLFHTFLVIFESAAHSPMPMKCHCLLTTVCSSTSKVNQNTVHYRISVHRLTALPGMPHVTYPTLPGMPHCTYPALPGIPHCTYPSSPVCHTTSTYMTAFTMLLVQTHNPPADHLNPYLPKFHHNSITVCCYKTKGFHLFIYIFTLKKTN